MTTRIDFAALIDARIALSGAGVVTETVQDIVGAFLAAGVGVTVTYDDAGNILTISSTAATIRNQATTADTLVLADAGKVIRETAAGATVQTVPPNSAVAFPVGTVIGIYAAGAGGTTITAGAGVTIRNNGTALVQYQEVSLRKDATDEWVRAG